LAAGVTIVHFRNVGRADRTIVITVLGWLILLLGGLRMFLATARQVSDKNTALGILFALLLAGLFLTVKTHF